MWTGRGNTHRVNFDLVQGLTSNECAARDPPHQFARKCKQKRFRTQFYVLIENCAFLIKFKSVATAAVLERPDRSSLIEYLVVAISLRQPATALMIGYDCYHVIATTLLLQVATSREKVLKSTSSGLSRNGQMKVNCCVPYFDLIKLYHSSF